MVETYTPQKLTLPHIFTSIIVRGNGEGKKLGFPTANFLRIPTTQQIGLGVYYGLSSIETQPKENYSNLPSLAYFGPRHINGETQNIFEVFVYDLDELLYGKQLSIQLTHFLRGPVEFVSVDQLKKQLRHDTEVGRSLVSN